MQPPSSLSRASANTPQSSPPPLPALASPSSAKSKATGTAPPAHSNPHCRSVEQSAPSSLPQPERSSIPAATAPPRTQEYFPVPPSSQPATSASSFPTRPSSRREKPATSAPSQVRRTQRHTSTTMDRRSCEPLQECVALQAPRAQYSQHRAAPASRSAHPP